MPARHAGAARHRGVTTRSDRTDGGAMAGHGAMVAGRPAGTSPAGPIVPANGGPLDRRRIRSSLSTRMYRRWDEGGTRND